MADRFIRSLSWQSPEIPDGSSGKPVSGRTDRQSKGAAVRARATPGDLIHSSLRHPQDSRQIEAGGQRAGKSAGRPGRQPERLPGTGSPSAATFSWLLSMSANSLAVSAEIPMAGASSTTATARPFVSQTIQPFVTFLTVYLTTRKALAGPSVPGRGARPGGFSLAVLSAIDLRSSLCF